MLLTVDMLRGLRAYKRDKNLTNVELAAKLQLTPQHLGRILRGTGKSLNDRSAGLLMEVLGLDKDVITIQVADRPVFAVNCHTDSMSPTVENGSTILVEPKELSELANGDVVVCRIQVEDPQELDTIIRTTIRVFSRHGSTITLTPVNTKNGAGTYNVSPTKIQWIARMLLPTRNVDVRD